MKKRLWITLLTLAFTLGGLCAGAAAAVQSGTIPNTAGVPAALEDGNTTTEPCSHDGSAAVYDPTDGMWKCPCGQVTFAASVTVGGATTYYQNIQDAFDNADGGTVKPLKRFVDDPVTISKNVTLDLSAMETTSYFKEFSVTGSLTVFADGSGTAVDINRLALPVVVKNGGTLTVPAECSVGTTNCVQLVSSVTVETGGSVTIHGGSVNVIHLLDGSKAELTGGTFGSVSIFNASCRTAISGGSYGSVNIYERYYNQSGQLEDVRPAAVTYADFAALLTGGKAFQLTGGTGWATGADLVPSDNLYVTYKTLENVTAADAPLTGVTITGADSVQYGVAAELTADAATTATAGDPSALTYQWYRVDAAGGRTAIENAADKNYPLPTQDVGRYTYAVTVNCGGYTVDSEPFTVTVEPRRLDVFFLLDEASVTKVYDGAADNTRVIAELFRSYPDKHPIPGDAVKYTITDVYYGDSHGNRSPDAADSKHLYGTLTLTDPNYMFYGFFGPETSVRTFAMSGRITQAPALAAQEGALTVANGQAAVYFFDFKSLLPEPDAPKLYGDTTYELGTVDLGSYYIDGAAITDGVLTLPIQAVSSVASGEIGTVTVTVKTRNFQSITLTLRVSAANKALPALEGDVTLSRDTLTYGQTLDTISLSGTMKYGGQTVAGTFSWQKPGAKLNAGSPTACWVFTPAEEDTYLTVTGTANITVNKATPTGAPKYTPITASGKTLADAGLALNDSWPAGFVDWMYTGTDHTLDSATEVLPNTVYEWLFLPYDSANYEPLRGALTPYRRSSGGGSASYPVNVPGNVENGSVSAGTKKAAKGDTVTITVTPDSGFQLGDLTMTDKDGNKLSVTDKGSGKYTFTMPGSAVTVSAAFVQSSAGKTGFKDVADDAYYADAVEWAVSKGVTSGIGDSLFGSDLACTRAQIVTFLWRAAGSPEPKSTSSFSDVAANAYYAKAVAWAVENSITAGTGGGKFSPDAPCTRAQCVTFLWRAQGQPSGSGVRFSDVPADSYYAQAVAWAAAKGVTLGIGGGLFGPDQTCTRAQIVTFLYHSMQ